MAAPVAAPVASSTEEGWIPSLASCSRILRFSSSSFASISFLRLIQSAERRARTLRFPWRLQPPAVYISATLRTLLFLCRSASISPPDDVTVVDDMACSEV